DDGLRVLQARSADLACIDQQLADASGLELCRRIRASPSIRELPIIVITSGPQESDRLAALEAGADDCVSRPIATRELMLRATTVLRRAGAQDTWVRVGAI